LLLSCCHILLNPITAHGEQAQAQQSADNATRPKLEEYAKRPSFRHGACRWFYRGDQQVECSSSQL
jgi:hypothetical protein